jgi:hypothetical protein
MKKTYKKLIAAIALLVVSACMVVSVSYAWLTVSESPAVNGIQVSIGGGRTILLAADVTETAEDGSVLHYPGTFQSKLVFAQYATYDYLSTLGALRPVSTANGVDWIAADYYTMDEEDVVNGTAYAGAMKDITAFTVDSLLENANLTEDEAAQTNGCYVYLDFWIVSPGSDYELRVSTGSDGGSFVIGLPYPTEDASTLTGYTLSDADSAAANSARIGFLVNGDTLQDASMLAYQRSASYSDQYTHLLGVYAEKGTSSDTTSNTFTIYEPNGTAHTEDSGIANGSYVITEPLGVTNGTIAQTSVASILTVQTENRWTNASSEGSSPLENLFQAALTGKKVGNAAKAFSLFYTDYLQGQVAAYVNCGDFYTNTANLYAYATALNSKELSTETLGSLQTAGATDDVYITRVQKNVPQRIRMFIWLEGQDADCIADGSLAGLALNLELAGSR